MNREPCFPPLYWQEDYVITICFNTRPQKLFPYTFIPSNRCGGFPVTDARDAAWTATDRRFMVVDSMGEFKTIREVPAMATVKTAMDGDELLMTNPSRRHRAGATRRRRRPRARCGWASRVQAHAVSDEADALPRNAPAKRFSLMYMPDLTARTLGKARSSRRHRELCRWLSAAGGVGFLSGGFESSHCRERPRPSAHEPLSRQRGDRWRGAFAEDRLGPMTPETWRLRGQPVRCQVTTTDQTTGESWPSEPLATLSTFRRTPDDVWHHNCIPDAEGVIRIGDAVAWSGVSKQ